MKLRLVRIFYWTAVTTCLVVVFCARFRFSADFLSFYSDDYFYVLKVAQNIVTHHLSTFDGSTPTNGYHPLWTVINVILLYIFHGKAFFYALAIVSIACGIATFQLIRTIAKLNGVNEPASLFTAFVGVWWSLKLVRGEMEVVIAIPLVLGMLVWIMMPAFSWTRDATVYGLLASLAVLARLDVVLLVALLLAFQLLAQIIHKEFEAKSWLRGAMRFVLGGILLPAYIAIHCCPATSRTDSIGCQDRLSRYRSLLPEVPVKWAFSRIELG